MGITNLLRSGMHPWDRFKSGQEEETGNIVAARGGLGIEAMQERFESRPAAGGPGNE